MFVVMELGITRREWKVTFQPIIDTADSRVFAYQCSLREARSSLPYWPSCASGTPARIDPPPAHGLIFIEVSELRHPDSAAHMPKLPNMVYQVRPEDSAVFSESSGTGASARKPVIALLVTDVGPQTVAAIERLRPCYLKLDASLATTLEHPGSGKAVRSLVQFAERRGLILIAEGVSNAETVENLWLLGLRNMQGHFFSCQNAHNKLVKPVWAR